MRDLNALKSIGCGGEYFASALCLIKFNKVVYKELGGTYSFLGWLSRIYLVGQSAGAHLGACALLLQAEKQITDGTAGLTWISSQIKAYVALSGGLVNSN